MLLPTSEKLVIQVPDDARTSAYASFDGRHRIELEHGDGIVITKSKYDVYSVCSDGESRDWFESLRRCLHWNERTRQKPFLEDLADDSESDLAIDEADDDEQERGDALDRLAFELFKNEG